MNEDGKIVAGQRLYLRDGENTRPLRSTKSNSQSPSHHWFLKISVGLLIICSLIWLYQKGMDPRTFPVHKVQITGNYNHIDHAELRQVVLPFLQSGFLALDVAGLQDRVQQLPWVDSVNIKRKWPDRLVITIQEQKPIARFNDSALVNNRGEVFAVDATSVPADLPLFMGPQGQQKLILQNYQEMAPLLTPLGVKISMLSLNARQAWALQLDNGIVVLLGKVVPVPRLQRFVKIYAQVVGSKAAQISSVDLRYTSGVAVKFKNQNV